MHEQDVHRHSGRVRKRVHDGARLRGLEVEERELEGLQDLCHQACRQQQGLDFISCQLCFCLISCFYIVQNHTKGSISEVLINDNNQKIKRNLMNFYFVAEFDRIYSALKCY